MTATRTSAETVCHCRQVSYADVESAIDHGAHSLRDVQLMTTACTRCFGCRFELEALLRDRLGTAFVETEFLTQVPVVADVPRRSWLPWRRTAVAAEAPALPRRMYMPVLVGYRGLDVETRVVVFNWRDPSLAEPEPQSVRIDVLALDGRRVSARNAVIAPNASLVLDVREVAGGDPLSDGAGVVKIVTDTNAIHSLRPYFQFISPGGLTSTHEKAGVGAPAAFSGRPFHWLFPIGYGAAPEEAYFFCLNTQERPMEDQRLVWKPDSGDEVAIPLPRLGLDQSALVPVHEHAPAVASGATAGSIRLDPAAHKVAGFMIRRDPAADLWRVQHL